MAGDLLYLPDASAPVQSLVPALNAAGTFNGAGVDAIDALVILWVIDLGATAGAPTSQTIQVSVQDSNDNGVTDAFAQAQDRLGNAIQSAVLTAGSQILYLAERSGVELNANSFFRASRRFRRAVLVQTFVGGATPTTAAEVHAVIVKRRLPTAAVGENP